MRPLLRMSSTRSSAVSTSTVRGVALQAQQDRLGGAVAVSGGAEGPEEFGAHGGDADQQSVVLQSLGEHPGGAHRAHGVRTGRAYADREEVEDGNGHGEELLGFTDPVVRGW